MFHKNFSQKRTAAPTALTTRNNVLKILKHISIPCMALTFFTSCRPGNGEPNMVLIPAGKFQMGSHGPVEMHGPQEDEMPRHTVYVDAFYMDKYEVTNAAYKKFIDANPKWRKGNVEFQGDESYLLDWEENTYPNGKGNHPVNVNWYAAMAYAKWVGKRLPTEAEWEKAARGGLKNERYPWGSSINPSMANYEVNSFTVPVGSYAPNNYGLYDMAGNVEEWCLDAYQADFYKDSPDRNSIAGTDSVTNIINDYRNVKSPRVLRGGGWVFGADAIRVSKRYKLPPEKNSRSIGFRCVKPVKP